MAQQCNHAYYLRRAGAAEQMADESDESGIRKLHLTMAKEYRARAARIPPLADNQRD